MVHAYQAGKLKHPPAKIKQVAKHVSPTDAGHFAETSHEGLPEHVKKAFVEAFIQEAVDAGATVEQIPDVVKRACLDPKTAAYFSDFIVKSSADEGGRGSSGSSSAPPSSSSPPATPSSTRGLGNTPGVRRFMTGMAGMVQGVTRKKPAIHPLDVKNTLAIAEVASRRRAEMSPPPAPPQAAPAPQPAQPAQPAVQQPVQQVAQAPVDPMQAQAANPSPMVPTNTPYVPGMPKVAEKKDDKKTEKKHHDRSFTAEVLEGAGAGAGIGLIRGVSAKYDDPWIRFGASPAIGALVGAAGGAASYPIRRIIRAHLDKAAEAAPSSPFQPSPAPKMNLKRPVNVTNPMPGIKPPAGISTFRRNPATMPHTGPRAIRPAAPVGAL